MTSESDRDKQSDVPKIQLFGLMSYWNEPFEELTASVKAIVRARDLPPKDLVSVWC